MATRRNSKGADPAAAPQAVLPAVCIITMDQEFLDVLIPEIAPWFEVIVRDGYDGLARWSREEDVAAVLLDIDTQGEDAFGGLQKSKRTAQAERDDHAHFHEPGARAFGGETGARSRR